MTGSGVTCMILVSALFRVLKIDWFGSEELTLMVGGWLYFIGGIRAARDGTHISGDMLNIFIKSEKILHIFNIIKMCIAIIMSIFFTVWTYQFLIWQISLGAVSAVYKLPNYISLIPIPLFFTFWIIYLLKDMYYLMRSYRQSIGGDRK